MKQSGVGREGSLDAMGFHGPQNICVRRNPFRQAPEPWAITRTRGAWTTFCSSRASARAGRGSKKIPGVELDASGNVVAYDIRRNATRCSGT